MILVFTRGTRYTTELVEFLQEQNEIKRCICKLKTLLLIYLFNLPIYISNSFSIFVHVNTIWLLTM